MSLPKSEKYMWLKLKSELHKKKLEKNSLKIGRFVMQNAINM